MDPSLPKDATRAQTPQTYTRCLTIPRFDLNHNCDKNLGNAVKLPDTNSFMILETLEKTEIHMGPHR